MIYGDQRKYNKPGKWKGQLTARLNLYITPQMRKEIEKRIKDGKFSNISEFVRYCIRRYLDGA